ncbi:proximal sequence element A Pbp95 isoform 3-T3 [Cochliomyia hominivorax]
MATNTNDEMKSKLEDTLKLNQQMQIQLKAMKGKLEKLLLNVKESYKNNEILLKDGIIRRRKKGVGIKGAYLKGGTFYLKGNMFFKDINCRNCPNNPDYESRKLEKEMFPMDLNLKSRHVWSTQDKQRVILGIKEQIVDYMSQSHSKQEYGNKEINSEKLAKLLQIVPQDFSIDWDHISSYNLQHRHTAKTCEAIWNLFLHPSLKRCAWSEEENQKLLEAAKKYNFQNWQAIANEVGKRSDFQCFVQYQNYVCYLLPESSTKWTKEDDKRLREVIAKNMVNGIINWSNVNAHFPHKAKTTLHTRYNYTLNPAISHGAQFTPEEDLLLIAAVKEYGTKFNCIPRTLFPNRSLVQLRAHYKNVLAKRHNHHPWSLEDDVKLMEFVTANGTKEWLQCEHSFNGKHSRTSCRTRFLTIKKYLEKNPDASIEDIGRKRLRATKSINIENWKDKIVELSTNPNGVELNKTENEFVGKPKVEKIKKSTKEKVKRTKKLNIRTTSSNTIEPNEVLQLQLYENQTNDEKKPILQENQTTIIDEGPRVTKKLIRRDRKSKAMEKFMIEIPSEEGNLQSITKNELKKCIRKTKPEEKIKEEKPYLPRLRANALKNYNFFKYAYNLNMDQHPCDNIQIINNDLSLTVSALNPQISSLPEAYEFSSSIPEHIKQNIKTSFKQVSTNGNLPLLPPNWSTAMGFRALCIQTFRERLRSLFYSTALLSRLSPNLVGITTMQEIETPKVIKRKRSYSKKDNEDNINKKSKCVEVIDNIKTELEM